MPHPGRGAPTGDRPTAVSAGETAASRAGGVHRPEVASMGAICALARRWGMRACALPLSLWRLRACACRHSCYPHWRGFSRPTDRPDPGRCKETSSGASYRPRCREAACGTERLSHSGMVTIGAIEATCSGRADPAHHGM
eukprot:1768844-Prymnesium_polylepis.1